MPWCEPCGAFYNPNTLEADGTCPRCGAQVGDASTPHGAASSESIAGIHHVDEDEEIVAKVPWHFWVGVTAMVIYLGWRLIQGVSWFF